MFKVIEHSIHLHRFPKVSLIISYIADTTGTSDGIVGAFYSIHTECTENPGKKRVYRYE